MSIFSIQKRFETSICFLVGNLFVELVSILSTIIYMKLILDYYLNSKDYWRTNSFFSSAYKITVLLTCILFIYIKNLFQVIIELSNFFSCYCLLKYLLKWFLFEIFIDSYHILCKVNYGTDRNNQTSIQQHVILKVMFPNKLQYFFLDM